MQDFFKQQPGWLKAWKENQEALTKQFAGLGEDWLKNMSGGKGLNADFFEGWFKSQGNLEEQFKEFSARMNEMMRNVWGNKIPADMMKYMNTSFIEAFYKNWLAGIELPGGIKNPLGVDGGWQQATNFLRSFMEKENPFFSAFNSGKLNDQISNIIGMLKGAFGSEGSAFADFIGNYQSQFGKLFDSSSAQGAEKLSEAFDVWVKEVTKQLSAPKLGLSREVAQDISLALVSTQDYFKAYSKMTQFVEKTSRKGNIRFQTKLSEAALKNKPVTKFTDFCNLWASENEAVFLEVMGTEEFAKIQGEFTDAGHRLKIQSGKLMEKALEPTPIALKRDLDLAIGEIQQLKRDMRAFRREIQAVQKEAEVARGAKAAAEEIAKNAKIAVKAAETAAQEELKKAKEAVKAAEVAAQSEAKKAKAAEAAVAALTKQVNADSKAAKAAPKATTKTKSKID
ncbi:MAG: poly(R)-hydroxyalkanoic acid synthase subunit PhaE [Desulfuromonadaceae bacterium]|nr:poly(R)-hydroxyalkanoic acid synthase subunit PhaE [Desulfuromonadaceae bacterium]